MNHTLHLRGLLAAGVSAAALIGAAPAFAAPASAAATGADTTVGEIIVTAEKREASIQSVPIAVTAFTSKERAIEGINTIQDMTNFTPGLTYSSQLDRPVMRGLARNNNVYTSDSAVDIYYDDVFNSTTYLTGRDDLLIDQVEVLLGPQGTLYGKNAVGGLINTISKRPSEDLGGEVRAIVGNFGYSKLEGTITGPLGNGWSFRASAFDINQYQGYFKNLSGNPDEGGIVHDPYGDLQLQYKGDKNEFWLDSYVFGQNNDRGGPGSLLGIPTVGHYDTALATSTDPIVFNPNLAYNPANVVPGSVVGMPAGVTDNPALKNIRVFDNAIPTHIQVDQAFAFNLHLIHHFDGFDVKYVGGYSQYHYDLHGNLFVSPSGITQFSVPNSVIAPTDPKAKGDTLVDSANGFEYRTFSKTYSQELDFTSTTNNRLQYIAGVYRFDGIDDNQQDSTLPDQPEVGVPALALLPNGKPNLATFGKVAPNPNFFSNYGEYQDHLMSSAIFTQLDYKITDTVKLTGGVRYTYDQKNASQETRLVAFSPLTYDPTVFHKVLAVDITPSQVDLTPQKGVTHLPVLATTGRFAGDYVGALGDTSSAVTGTAGVEWTPDHETLVYARYNRGYKAFGFAAGANGPGVEAAPEFVNDYEAGVKKSFGRRLTIDADVYYYDYTNAQIPIGVFSGNPPVSKTNFINIPKANSDGFELTANWVPIDNLNLSVVYGFDNTSIQSGCSLDPSSPTGTKGFCVVDPSDTTAIAPGAKPVGPSGVQSVKGDQLPQAPKNKVAFNANYTFEFEPGKLTLSGSYIWKDQSYGEIFDRFYTRAPAWDQVDLRATWAGDHDKYEVVLYVKNLFNTLGYDAAPTAATVVSMPIGGGGTTQAPSYDLTPPRLFGVEVHYKF